MSINQLQSSLSSIINGLTADDLLTLVSSNKLMLEHIEESKMTRPLIIAALINGHTDAVKYVSQFNNDEEFMLRVLAFYTNNNDKSNPFMLFAGADLRNSKKFILACVEANGMNAAYATFCDEEIAITAVSNYDHALSAIKPEFRTKKVCQYACAYSDHAIRYVPAEFLKDKEFITTLIDNNCDVILLLGEESLSLFTVKDDMNYIEAILKKNIVLNKCFPNFLTSREFVLKMVKINADILRNCNDDMRDDKEIIIAGIASTHSYSIKYASLRLRKDEEIVYNTFVESNRYKCSFHDAIFSYMGSNLKTTAFFYRLVENKLITKAQFDKFIKMEVIA